MIPRNGLYFVLDGTKNEYQKMTCKNSMIHTKIRNDYEIDKDGFFPLGPKWVQHGTQQLLGIGCPFNRHYQWMDVPLNTI